MKLEDFFKLHDVPPGGKLQVDRVFANRGAGVPLECFGGDFEHAKQYFDKPDELRLQDVNTGPFSLTGKMIIHQRDVAHIQQRIRIADDVLSEFGPPKSIEDVLKMRKEIDRRIAELN